MAVTEEQGELEALAVVETVDMTVAMEALVALEVLVLSEERGGLVEQWELEPHPMVGKMEKQVLMALMVLPICQTRLHLHLLKNGVAYIHLMELHSSNCQIYSISAIPQLVEYCY